MRIFNGEEGDVFGVSTASLDALFRKAKARVLIEDLHFHDSLGDLTPWEYRVKHEGLGNSNYTCN